MCNATSKKHANNNYLSQKTQSIKPLTISPTRNDNTCFPSSNNRVLKLRQPIPTIINRRRQKASDNLASREPRPTQLPNQQHQTPLESPSRSPFRWHSSVAAVIMGCRLNWRYKLGFSYPMPPDIGLQAGAAEAAAPEREPPSAESPRRVSGRPSGAERCSFRTRASSGSEELSSPPSAREETTLGGDTWR